MRLFRRSLFCLVVGVTAFGVAGWGFRPRPNWTVPTPGAFRLIVGAGHEISNDEPIWIESDVDGAAAFRATDGVLLQHIAPPDPQHTVADFFALPNGRIAIAPKSDRSQLHVFETKSNAPIASMFLDGDWTIGADWRHVWRLERQGAGYRFECRDAWTGRETRRLEFPNEFRTDLQMVADYSPEADLLAVSERLRLGRDAPFGVELREGTTGKVVRVVGREIPENDGSGPRWLCFLQGGGQLKYELIGASPFWVLPGVIDTTTGKATSPVRAALPIDGEGTAEVKLIADLNGRQAWTLNWLSPATAWVSLAGTNERAPQWHRVLGEPIIEETRRRGMPQYRVTGVTARIVPHQPALIVRTTEEALITHLPEPFTSLLPASLAALTRTTRHWWHDWETGAWRDVGCSGTHLDERAWPDALITLTETADGTPILQSWPLPPRDPKWPALGLAIASAAGMWWWCRWRYRRRTRLASVGAA